MLKQRLITAIILIPIIVWVLLNASSQTLAWVMGIFIALGAWEWAAICGWHNRMARSIYVIAMSLALLATHTIYTYIIYILLAACLWWLLATYWVLRYQKGQNLIPHSPFIKALLGFFILLPAWGALLLLHEHEGGRGLLFLFVLIWAADTGAYFAGRRWGQKKLAHKISPGKTWEGVAGALLMSSIVSLSYALLKSMPLMTFSFFMLLCILTVGLSILGDLLESLFKRQAGLKDSGQILPGHGGVLDRIDSLTSAAPTFVTGLILLGKVF